MRNRPQQSDNVAGAPHGTARSNRVVLSMELRHGAVDEGDEGVIMRVMAVQSREELQRGGQCKVFVKDVFSTSQSLKSVIGRTYNTMTDKEFVKRCKSRSLQPLN
jgi:hypothetical protein